MTTQEFNKEYLQEKIDMVGDRFKGVDVDEYVREIRGYDIEEEL